MRRRYHTRQSLAITRFVPTLRTGVEPRWSKATTGISLDALGFVTLAGDGYAWKIVARAACGLVFSSRHDVSRNPDQPRQSLAQAISFGTARRTADRVRFRRRGRRTPRRRSTAVRLQDRGGAIQRNGRTSPRALGAFDCPAGDCLSDFANHGPPL